MGLPNFGDLIEEILSSLGAPELPGVPTIADFTFDFDTPFNELIEQLSALVTDNFRLDRAALGLDVTNQINDALQRLPSPSGWFVYVASSDTGVLEFNCRGAGRYPVVYKVEASIGSCNQDLSAYFRFPCGRGGPGRESTVNDTCTKDYGAITQCVLEDIDFDSQNFPEEIEQPPGLTYMYHHAAYYCIPNGEEPPEVMPGLRAW